MKETVTMKFVTRKERTKGINNQLRKMGYLTGNISGRGIPSIAVAVKKDELRKYLNKYGRNTLFKLEGEENSTYNVMIKEIQISPVNHDFSHVDFQQITLSDEIKTEVLIKITGIELLESKHLYLNRQMDTILVTGLPQNIPENIEIDVSDLTPGEIITIGDLKLPKGIRTEFHPEQVILSASVSKNDGVQEEEPEEKTLG
ncbi:50S ribosomal protein L25 [Anaerocolumna sedimenticola]|uniref:Large ribosomal subunit protein bL25 n=1 Tax=Anaerocolumna sedimenticola TaxID=2696063 RepID=A0A6P1TKY7_9FIRM|nr:50S ribosomal protein L25 [Anaerocolumna sedimenticola]QHQ61093.1 50S ribosomal protein L25 [Anaerocolumna sedimenticola]